MALLQGVSTMGDSKGFRPGFLSDIISTLQFPFFLQDKEEAIFLFFKVKNKTTQKLESFFPRASHKNLKISPPCTSQETVIKKCYDLLCLIVVHKTFIPRGPCPRPGERNVAEAKKNLSGVPSLASPWGRIVFLVTFLSVCPCFVPLRIEAHDFTLDPNTFISEGAHVTLNVD